MFDKLFNKKKAEPQPPYEPAATYGVWMQLKNPHIKKDYKRDQKTGAWMYKHGEIETSSEIVYRMYCLFINPKDEKPDCVFASYFNVDVKNNKMNFCEQEWWERYKVKDYEPIADPKLIKKLQCLMDKHYASKDAIRAAEMNKIKSVALKQTCK